MFFVSLSPTPCGFSGFCQQTLGGGFKYFLSSPHSWGNDPIWYFSVGLVQPRTGSICHLRKAFWIKVGAPSCCREVWGDFSFGNKEATQNNNREHEKTVTKKTRELFPKKKSGFAFTGLVCRSFEKCTSTWWIFVYRFEAAGSFAMILNACLNLCKELSKTPPPTYINN